MVENVRLGQLEHLWERQGRRDQIKELEEQLEEPGEWVVEWETVREQDPEQQIPLA